MSVITRQYRGPEDLIKLNMGHVLILNTPSGPMYAKVVPGLTCAGCCMDTDPTSTADNACMMYKFLCSSPGMTNVMLKRVDPEQIVEELM
jgi:hypothetical protein